MDKVNKKINKTNNTKNKKLEKQDFKQGDDGELTDTDEPKMYPGQWGKVKPGYNNKWWNHRYGSNPL